VALDDVSRDFGGVTRREIGWYAKAFSDDLKVCGFLDRNGEARIFEMSHPTRATTAVWILMNKDRCGLGKRRNRRHDQCQRSDPECVSPRQTARMNDRWTTHDLGLQSRSTLIRAAAASNANSCEDNCNTRHGTR
jgi:hypothetical protein